MPKALQSTAAFAAKLQAYLTQIVSMSHTTNVDTVSERGRACHPPRIRHQSATAVLRGNKPVPNLKYATELGVCKGHYRLLDKLLVGPAIEQNTRSSIISGLVANLASAF